MKQLPTTILSGFLGSGKTTLLKRILENTEGMKIAVIVNDMAEVNIDAQLIATTHIAHTKPELVEMTNGCICCTLREDLLIEITRLAKQNVFDYLVIESTGISEPMPVAATFTFETEDGSSLSHIANIDTMVTVVDATTFCDDYLSEDMIARKEAGVTPEDERMIVDLLIDQIEFANVIILNKCDMVSSEEQEFIEIFVRKLNPKAVIHRAVHSNVPLSSILHTGMFDMDEASNAAGWAQELLRGEDTTHVPETEEYGIRSFVYRSRLPLHPERFYNFLQSNWHGVLRAKGFFWLASRMDFVGQVSQAGQVRTHGLAGIWLASSMTDTSEMEPEEREHLQRELAAHPWGDRRQEIVFIGDDLHEDELRSQIDQCLLTDAEYATGQDVWKTYIDPFPAWMSEQIEA